MKFLIMHICIAKDLPAGYNIMKKYYVTYLGGSSGTNYYVKFNNKREAYIYTTCLQFLIRLRGWRYESIKIRGRLLDNVIYLERDRKEEFYNYVRNHIKCLSTSNRVIKL